MPTDRLGEAHRTVPDDSSSSNDPQNAATAEPDPGSGAGDSAGQGKDSGEGKDGRSVENVRGELLRKMEKEFQALREELSAARTAPAPESSSQNSGGAPSSLDDMSIQELEALKGQVPENQKMAFEEYLSERKLDERVNRRLNEHVSKERFRAIADESNDMAFRRWPQLRDKTSDMYRKTNAILKDIPEDNPRAVLDAANEAGVSLGLAPVVNSGPTLRTRTPHLASGSSNAPSGQKDSEDLSPEQKQKIQGIGDNLKNAFPGGKISDEAMKRIMENSADYMRHKHLFVQR